MANSFFELELEVHAGDTGASAGMSSRANLPPRAEEPPAREERRSRDPWGGTTCAAAEVQRELGTSARAYAYARPSDILASEATEYAEPGAGPASAICAQNDDATNGPRGAKAKA